MKALRPMVVHIAPDMGEVEHLRALCGLDRGRACKDPGATTLTIDRYCSRCWNRWAKEIGEGNGKGISRNDVA